LIELYLIKS